jgi:hypothetical protein
VQVQPAAATDPLAAQYELERTTLARFFPDQSLAASALPRELTDVEAEQIGVGLHNLAKTMSMLMRRDVSFASLNPLSPEAQASMAAIAQRADGLRELIDFRPRALSLQPKLISQWTDWLDEWMQELVVMSEDYVRWARDGTFLRRSASDALLDGVRFLPTAYGDLRETSADVLDFCARENLAEHLLMATIIMRRSFPEAMHLLFELERDPESDGEWITINVRVSPEGAFERYERYIAGVVEAIPDDALEKIRLCYDVR